MDKETIQNPWRSIPFVATLQENAMSDFEAGQARVKRMESNNRRTPSTPSQKTPRKAGVQKQLRHNAKKNR